MLNQVAELLGGLIGVAVYGVVATALTVVGVLAELTGVQNLQTGQLAVGAWEVAVGLIALYAAVSVVREFVLPELRGAT
jgi:hypothetical protein